jgi:2-polyprenyl-3-methyl-5-hydroxy-6-metoxy-1,4-benzoquinol methylase
MAAMLDSSQYGDSGTLRKRSNLHARYGRRSWFQWVAAKADFLAGSEIIDIGCGGGWFWSSAENRLPSGLRLTLVDASEGLVMEAGKLLSGSPHFAAVKTELANATALPFGDRTFDAAVAMHVLYHVADPRTTIAEMARLVKPEGVALVTTNGDDNLRELFELGSKITGEPASDPGASFFGGAEAEIFLRKYFDDVEIFSFEDQYVIDDADPVVDYLMSLSSVVDTGGKKRHQLYWHVSEWLTRNGGFLRTKRQSVLALARKPI